MEYEDDGWREDTHKLTRNGLVPNGGPPRDNWYRDDWFNRQEQWQFDRQRQEELQRDKQRGYQYHRETDDRYITRLRSPSPERPRWTNRDMMAYQNRSLDRGVGGLFHQRRLQEEEEHDDFYRRYDHNRIAPLQSQPQPQPQPQAQQQKTHPATAAAVAIPNGRVSNDVKALREAAGLPAAAGRRLPQPPPEAQKAVFMSAPHSPLPSNQRIERLSTRNRRLPQIPTSAAQAASAGAGELNTITNSFFGFAKKIGHAATAITTPSQPHPPHNWSVGRQQQQHQLQPPPPQQQQQQQTVFHGQQPQQQQQQPGFFGRLTQHFPTAPPLKSSQSFNNTVPQRQQQQQQQQQRRPGRGAKLPQVPTTAAAAAAAAAAAGSTTAAAPPPPRRRLPDHSGLLSRSLDHQQNVGNGKLETVLEAGRGVRKLPVPVVRTGNNNGAAANGPTPYERMLLEDHSLDAVTGNMVGMTMQPQQPPPPQPFQEDLPLPNWT